MKVSAKRMRKEAMKRKKWRKVPLVNRHGWLTDIQQDSDVSKDRIER